MKSLGDWGPGRSLWVQGPSVGAAGIGCGWGWRWGGGEGVVPPGTHHALDDAPERAALDVLGDEVEPLVFVEHPDELEHMRVLQASHDLHLGSGVQTDCAPIFSRPSHQKPPWAVLKEGESPHPTPSLGVPASPAAALPFAWAAPTPRDVPAPLALLAESVFFR